jgi:hypothetical protein
MPVAKYRSVADMPRPPRLEAADLALRIRAVWNRAFQICRPELPHGVSRFSTIEDANEARQQRTIDRMRKTAAKR